MHAKTTVIRCTKSGQTISRHPAVAQTCVVGCDFGGAEVQNAADVAERLIVQSNHMPQNVRFMFVSCLFHVCFVFVSLDVFVLHRLAT